jgi:hypothetical protein
MITNFIVFGIQSFHNLLVHMYLLNASVTKWLECSPRVLQIVYSSAGQVKPNSQLHVHVYT